MKWTIHRATAKVKNCGQRLDQFIAEQIPELSRTSAKKIIDLGGTHVNGRRVRSCSQALKTNDQLEIYIDHLPTDPYRIQPADIVFQDQYLIVLNKPAHIDTQPTHARYKGTLYEALLWHCKDRFRPQQKPELGMVQRLDRGTSGLIVFSIHPRAHKEMTRIIVEHQMEKRYLALVAGTPISGEVEIHSFLARSRKENRVKSVEKGGKEAITRYRLVNSFQDAALLDIELLTGRSHQIRAHLSEQGHPLLGDQRYGGSSMVAGVAVDRPMLHAAQLVFNHPLSGKLLDFSAPLPEDMNTLIKRLETP